jgi:hypothetical protein
MNDSLVRQWKSVAGDLGLVLLERHSVRMESGDVVVALMLVKNFGGIAGTLIFNDHSLVSKHLPQLVQLGFGYSILEEPRENAVYNKENIIEILSEWGWTGPANESPNWIHH